MASTPFPSAARWSQIEPLLDEALALPTDQRPAFVNAACGADPLLRAELEQMLARCTLPLDRLDVDRPAAERFASLFDERVAEAALVAALDDRYVIEGEAGRGGMAIVYRARDRRDGRVVALKVLRATASLDGAARFRREIAVASHLEHPGILPLIESGECEGRIWFTMQFIEGDSLAMRLEREHRLEIRDAITLLRELADAVAHAHAQGVIHRDLKPENILFKQGRAVITDFGVAKAIAFADGGQTTEGDISTATGIGVGTPAYMSPEQAAGEKSINHLADLYALGVVAYQVLAGVPPFLGNSRQALLTAHLARRPAPLSTHRADVPKELNSLVMHLLAKQPADRPSSAIAVADALGVIDSQLELRGVPRRTRASAFLRSLLSRWQRPS